MYTQLFNELIGRHETRIDEVLSAGEIKQMRDQLDTPEICPMSFDVTILRWLERIEDWGKITYYHKDPEKSYWKKKVTKKIFLDRISDEGLNKTLGKWEIKKNKLNGLKLYH